MSYKVLYRKYRPDNFDNIIGQDYTIKTLKNSIINNKVSHAYIFSGPRGTGKTSTAKVFAKALNCESPIDGSPCNNCSFCNNFLENPDIIEIDAASNNGVDQIRNLIDNIKLSPSNGKYKVYIIDEVHMLTTSAFNALLLTLEEPPKHAIFILATTNIENVPVTILSRCQRFDFQKISNKDISASLRKICDLENIVADDEALDEIAYLSEGGMRDSLSILDQLSKLEEKITLDLIEKEIKIISKKNIDDVFNTIESNDLDGFVNLLREYSNRNVDYKMFVKKMIDVGSKRALSLKSNPSKYVLNSDNYKKMVLLLIDSLNKININVNPFVTLEMLLLDFFSTENFDVNNEKIIKKDDKIELSTEVKKNSNSTSELKNNMTSKNNFIEAGNNFVNIRINNCFVSASKESLEKAKELLNNLKNDLNITGKVKSIIEDAQVVVASEKIVVLSMLSDHLAEDANENILAIEKAFNSIINEDSKIKLVFISENKWIIEKNKYIGNLKKGYVYKEICENEDNQMQEKLTDVFDLSKIEII